jgi:hypothetical protein
MEVQVLIDDVLESDISRHGGRVVCTGMKGCPEDMGMKEIVVQGEDSGCVLQVAGILLT